MLLIEAIKDARWSKNSASTVLHEEAIRPEIHLRLIMETKAMYVVRVGPFSAGHTPISTLALAKARNIHAEAPLKNEQDSAGL